MRIKPLAWLIIAGIAAVADSAPAQPRILLFDGETLQGWTTQDGQPVTKGWEVVDGMLHLRTGGQRGGNIFTDREYGDFDLSFEWKIAAGGNNGVKYRVAQYGNKTLGCEYQLIDDDGYGYKLPETGRTGALYDIYEPNAKAMNPIGEFNQSRIVVCGDRIEHWLNGQLIVTAYVGSQEWRQRIAASKFADAEGFGENRWGKIMLTDHNSEVWFRSIELTPFDSVAACQGAVSCERQSRGLWRRMFRRIR